VFGGSILWGSAADLLFICGGFGSCAFVFGCCAVLGERGGGSVFCATCGLVFFFRDFKKKKKKKKEKKKF
jgi:hypothetical protein